MKRLLSWLPMLLLILALQGSAFAVEWSLPDGWYVGEGSPSSAFSLIQMKIVAEGPTNPRMVSTHYSWTSRDWVQTLNTANIVQAKGDLGSAAVKFQVLLDTPNGSADNIKVYCQAYNNQNVRVWNEAWALPGNTIAWYRITPLWEQATPVPEPSCLVAMLSGLAGIGGLSIRSLATRRR